LYPYGDTRTDSDTLGVPVDDDADERAARRTLRFLAVAVFVAVMAVTLVVSLSALDGSSPASTAGPPPEVETVTTLPAPFEIGPAPGTAIAGFVPARKTALAAARDERLAVVSFARYSTPAQTKTLLGALPVVGLLVAPPGLGPSVVTGDLATWLKTQSAATTSERDEIKKLIPTVDDPGFKAFYTSEVVRLDKALKSFAPDSALVFGAVVRGQAPALQALGARTEVRLVDVGETAVSPANAVFRGLRPEEVAKANEPALRPA